MNPILIQILWAISGIALVAWLFGVSEVVRLKPWQQTPWNNFKAPNQWARMLVLPFVVTMNSLASPKLDHRVALERIRASLRRLLRQIGALRTWLAKWVAPPIALANAAEDGTHTNGILTKKTDAAIATRYLLGKFGSDGDHVAVAGAADFPIGVILDEASAAEEPVAIQCIPCAGTIRVVTDGSGALVVGDLLIPAAGGKVKKVAAAVGNQFIVGRVLTAPATVDGTPFEAMAIGGYYNTAVS